MYHIKCSSKRIKFAAADCVSTINNHKNTEPVALFTREMPAIILPKKYAERINQLGSAPSKPKLAKL
jgi:hypothetical protein